jgi:hypothetical protein
VNFLVGRRAYSCQNIFLGLKRNQAWIYLPVLNETVTKPTNLHANANVNAETNAKALISSYGYLTRAPTMQSDRKKKTLKSETRWDRQPGTSQADSEVASRRQHQFQTMHDPTPQKGRGTTTSRHRQGLLHHRRAHQRTGLTAQPGGTPRPEPLELAQFMSITRKPGGYGRGMAGICWEWCRHGTLSMQIGQSGWDGVWKSWGVVRDVADIWSWGGRGVGER